MKVPDIYLAREDGKLDVADALGRTGFELAFRKVVTLQTHGLDKYKRTLTDVLLPDGSNVNHTLVKDGWCWWYRKYAPGNSILRSLQRDPRGGHWLSRHLDRHHGASLGRFTRHAMSERK